MSSDYGQNSAKTARRDYVLDVAKGIGLLLVYFGHMLEKFVWLFTVVDYAQTAAFLTWKVLYSFHMALFFVVSGLQFGMASRVSDASHERVSLARDTNKLVGNFFIRRLLPFVVFSALGVTLNGLMGQWPEQNGEKGLEFYPYHYMDMFKGMVHPWTVQWFLLSIAVIEFVFWLPRRLGWLGRRNLVLGAAVLILSISLWWLALPRASVPFYFHPASLGVTIALTLFGVWGAELWSTKDRARRLPVAIAASALCFGGALLNGGGLDVWLPSVEQILSNRFAVLFVLGWYGHPLWFVLAALSGSLVVLILSQEVTKIRMSQALAAVGREGLTLFLINGFFFAFINGHIAASLAPAGGVNSSPALVFVSLAVAVGELSLAWIAVVAWRRIRSLLGR